MNPHSTYCARVLMEEVVSIDEDAQFQNGDIDGLGWFRSLTITTGDPLGMAEAISRAGQIDRRIFKVECDDPDYVKVTFPTDRIVDSRAGFGIKDLYDALAEVRDVVDEPQSTEPAPRTKRKRTTKKAAAAPIEDVELPAEE